MITLSPEADAVYRPFDPDMETNLDYTASRDEDAERSRNSYTAYLKADVKLKDWVVTSLSGFTTSEDYYNLDGDFSGAPNVTLQLDEEFNQYSQEFRLISPPGRFEFIAGLYLFHATLEGGNDTRAFNYDEGGSEVVNVILPAALRSAGEEAKRLAEEAAAQAAAEEAAAAEAAAAEAAAAEEAALKEAEAEIQAEKKEGDE